MNTNNGSTEAEVSAGNREFAEDLADMLFNDPEGGMLSILEDRSMSTIMFESEEDQKLATIGLRMQLAKNFATMIAKAAENGKAEMAAQDELYPLRCDEMEALGKRMLEAYPNVPAAGNLIIGVAQKAAEIGSRNLGIEEFSGEIDGLMEIVDGITDAGEDDIFLIDGEEARASFRKDCWTAVQGLSDTLVAQCDRCALKEVTMKMAEISTKFGEFIESDKFKAAEAYAKNHPNAMTFGGTSEGKEVYRGMMTQFEDTMDQGSRSFADSLA